MTEVGGDGASYIDPDAPLEAARHIADAWPNRLELGARGLARSGEWTQSRTIERYVAAYTRIASRRRATALV